MDHQIFKTQLSKIWEYYDNYPFAVDDILYRKVLIELVDLPPFPSANLKKALNSRPLFLETESDERKELKKRKQKKIPEEKIPLAKSKIEVKLSRSSERKLFKLAYYLSTKQLEYNGDDERTSVCSSKIASSLAKYKKLVKHYFSKYKAKSSDAPNILNKFKEIIRNEENNCNKVSARIYDTKNKIAHDAFSAQQISSNNDEKVLISKSDHEYCKKIKLDPNKCSVSDQVKLNKLDLFMNELNQFAHEKIFERHGGDPEYANKLRSNYDHDKLRKIEHEKVDGSSLDLYNKSKDVSWIRKFILTVKRGLNYESEKNSVPLSPSKTVDENTLNEKSILPANQNTMSLKNNFSIRLNKNRIEKDNSPSSVQMKAGSHREILQAADNCTKILKLYLEYYFPFLKNDIFSSPKKATKIRNKTTQTEVVESRKFYFDKLRKLVKTNRHLQEKNKILSEHLSCALTNMNVVIVEPALLEAFCPSESNKLANIHSHSSEIKNLDKFFGIGS